MIIDAHAHFEPALLDTSNLIKELDQNNISKVALIPALNSPIPDTPETLLSLIRMLMQFKQGRAIAEVIFRLHFTKKGDLRISNKIYEIYPHPNNLIISNLIEQHPDRFLGWFFLNPSQNSIVVDELEYWRHKKGFIGVKLHPQWYHYNVDDAFGLVKRTQELQIPVLIHLGFGKEGDFKALIDHFPKQPFIMAHSGMPYFRELWHFIRDKKQVYVDLSGTYLNKKLVAKTIRFLGAEKCIYGTDSPYGFRKKSENCYDYGKILSWIYSMNLTDSERTAILSQNFLNIVEKIRQ